MHLDPSTRTNRPLRSLPLACALGLFVALTACESTSNGRPKSSKPSREQRDASPKSPAQWSMMGEMPEDGQRFDEEMTTVEIEVEEGAGPGGTDVIVERRVTRRTVPHGALRGAHGEPVRVPGRPLDMPAGAWMPVDGPVMAFTPGPNMAFDPSMGSGMGSGMGMHPGMGPSPSDAPKPAHPPVMLGVRMREVDPVLATHLGLDPRKCAVLEDVSEELGAHAGGLRDHDIIIEVDGSKLASPSHIRAVLRSKKPGDTVILKGRRADGEWFEATITLESFDHGKLLSVTPARVGG